MTYEVSDYWKECISDAAEECGVALSKEQLEHIAGSVQGGHENYGMAFYSPPSSDRYNQIEREHKAKIAKMEAEAERYRSTAEKVVGRILKQWPDARISITENGDVLRHDGRTERIA